MEKVAKTNLRFLSDEAISRIHEASLDLLENHGFKLNHKRGREMLAEAGADVDDETLIVKVPRRIVENCLATLPSKVVLGGRNSKYDVVLDANNGKTYGRTLTGGEGYIDFKTGAYRKVLLQDSKNWALIVDALDNIDLCTSPYPHDVHLDTRDILVLKTMLEYTEKPAVVQPYGYDNLKYMIDLALTISGSKEELKNRPLFAALTSPVSPLCYNQYAVDVIMLAGEYGIPVELCSMVNAGATGPVTISGLLLLTNAEVLAGIVISQIANPGAPLNYTPRSVILDMSSGSGLEAATENALIAAGEAQLARELYHMPSDLYGPVTDTLLVDGQSTIERSFNSLITGLAGADILASAGNIETSYSVSLLQLVIDNEIIGMAKRAIRGIDFNEDTLGLDVIKRVGFDGNFLIDEHTLRHFKTEYLRHKIFNRKPREVWKDEGKKSMEVLATEKLEDLLQNHQPVGLPESTLQEMEEIMNEAQTKVRVK